MPPDAPATLPPDAQLYPLAKAFEIATGRRPSPATLGRWWRAGIRGVRLETLRVGGQRMCSPTNAKTFLANVTRAVDGASPSSPQARTEADRSDAVDRASRELDELGG